MKILQIISLCCGVILISGCAVGISRKGYKLPPGEMEAGVGHAPIPIEVNMHFNTNDVVVLGSIHSYDKGFSLNCDEATVLNIFREDGRILRADVINITEEKQPSVWGSSCYRARAQFLRFKDRAVARALVSDPKYKPELVAARSAELYETLNRLSEVTSESAGDSAANAVSAPAGAANGAIAGAAYGVVGGLAYPRVSDLTPKDVHAIQIGSALGGMTGGLIAYSIAERNSPIKKLRHEALNGDANAQLDLGLDYEYGTSVNQNYVESEKWYQLAAESGNPIAENNLGRFFQYGLGTDTVPDYYQAETFYKESAKQGFPPAQSNLGYMYECGLGVETNIDAAVTWYRSAAEQGYPDAMMNLGISYQDGNGVARNTLIAYMWMDCARRLAEQSSDEQSKSEIRKSLAVLKKQMTPDQIQQGDALANQWYENFRKGHPVTQ